MSISIVRRNRPVLLQEVRFSTRTMRFPVRRLVTCCLCHQPNPILYSDEQTVAGACSECKQQADWAAMEARWQEQEESGSESCCTCGCD